LQQRDSTITPSELASTRERPRGERRPATLALLASAMLIVSRDQYIVVMALPEIGRALDFRPKRCRPSYERLRTWRGDARF
jgi:hypothetical protein